MTFGDSRGRAEVGLRVEPRQEVMPTSVRAHIARLPRAMMMFGWHSSISPLRRKCALNTGGKAVIAENPVPGEMSTMLRDEATKHAAWGRGDDGRRSIAHVGYSPPRASCEFRAGVP